MRTPTESEVRKLVREAVERALGAAGTPEPAPRRETPPVSPRRVAIGADHGGFALKEILRKAIADEMGWQVHDCGTHSEEAVDYPDFAAAVAREVASGRAARGIVVDAAGIGSTMAANKIAGVRCPLPRRRHGEELARAQRRQCSGPGCQGRESRRRGAAGAALSRHGVRRRPARAPGEEDHGPGRAAMTRECWMIKPPSQAREA